MKLMEMLTTGNAFIQNLVKKLSPPLGKIVCMDLIVIRGRNAQNKFL